MTDAAPVHRTSTGLTGPVAFWLGAALLAAAPWMRGGNRPAALILLELLAVLLLATLWIRAAGTPGVGWAPRSADAAALWLLVLAPAWLALVHLLPVPATLWAALPGHAPYAEAAAAARVELAAWLPPSLVPQATAVSLLAGLPLVALFLLGRASSLRRLRWLAALVVAAAFGQVLLQLLQLAGGEHSLLFFGADAARPLGSFANANHLGNYLAMALLLHLWLALQAMSLGPGQVWRPSMLIGADARHVAAWGLGAFVLLVGLLLSRSRGALLSLVPVLAVVLGWTAARAWRRQQGSPAPLLALLLIAAGGALLISLDSLGARLSGSELGASAATRGAMTRSTLEGAWAFFPWGAGWGTFADAYARFQPLDLHGYVGHAHQDYAQLLFEGGVFALLLAAAFAMLVVRRVHALIRPVRDGHVDAETLAQLLFGAALAVFLLHSLVEFNMHIPANAMVAAFAAGVFLRPRR